MRKNVRGVSTKVHTIVVGVNHRTAPIELREKLSFAKVVLPDAMRTLQEEKSILENIIVSTCNRTELYAVVEKLDSGVCALKGFLEAWFDLPIKSFDKHLIIHKDDQAIEHLLKVSVGMDSMILGETQILGQVRESFLQAQLLGTTKTIFNHLFKQAITFAKSAHAETKIGEHAVSISYGAVQLAKQTFGPLNHKHIAILGAGEMGGLTLRNLQGNGAEKVTVINRTFATAKEMVKRSGGIAKPITEVESTLLETDILISSTAATGYVIDYEVMKSVEGLRKGRPLFLIDIAVPRDIDPKIAKLSNVLLYDIDDLQGIVDANLAERQKAAEKISFMIEGQIIAFNEWLARLDAVPVITALRERAEKIQSTTMESILNKIPDLTEREQKVLAKHTASIVNQLLKEPILQAKELAKDPKSAEKLALFQQIFGIEEVSKDDSSNDSKEYFKNQLEKKEQLQFK